MKTDKKQIIKYYFLEIFGCALSVVMAKNYISNISIGLYILLLFSGTLLAIYSMIQLIGVSPERSTVVWTLLILGVSSYIMWGSLSNGGSSNRSSSTTVCQVCHRTFTDSANTKSIARTHMCKNCYSNYQWGQAATGK